MKLELDSSGTRAAEGVMKTPKNEDGRQKEDDCRDGKLGGKKVKRERKLKWKGERGQKDKRRKKETKGWSDTMRRIYSANNRRDPLRGENSED